MTEQDLAFVAKWNEFFLGLQTTEPDSILALLHPEVIAAEVDTPSITIRYPVAHWMRNPINNVHGGILCTMADSAAGALSGILSRGKVGSPTISLTMNYLRPVPTDSSAVIVRAACDKAGRTVNFLSVEAWREGQEGKLCFTATANFFVKQPTA